MQPLLPEDNQEVSLPKSCYFKDGKHKVDYVIVLPNIEEHVRGNRYQLLINKFIKHIEEKGLLIEKESGKFYNTLVFIKIHAPYKVLLLYARIYNILLTCQNPYYKFKGSILLKCLHTELTKPNPESEIYKRAQETLSGIRPISFTTAERSKIVYEILNHLSFINDNDEITLDKMLTTEIFLQAYAIHDGDCKWTTEGFLTDRQLLFKFWSNLSHIMQEQPIQIIQKYYGPKVGFYFALVNLYTKMLIVPSVVGSMTILVGLILIYTENHHLEEVCDSDIVLCSDQRLKTACGLMKLTYIIDNPVTIVYVILCSFWGVIFWNLWQRRQAMLRLRWNLSSAKADRTMRRDFQENAYTRRSSITGEIEYYVPPLKKIIYTLLTYFIVLIMISIFLLIVQLMVEYRFFLQKILNYDVLSAANEIELFTSSVLTTVIVIAINEFTSLVLKVYGKIFHFLTMLRMPRTQSQYNRIFLHLTFTLTFANHFSPLLYLAFVKGFFHKYPGDFSEIYIIKTFQSDLCKPAGCLVDLGMQLITMMIVKTLIKGLFDIIHHFNAPWNKDRYKIENREEFGQWEKDYPLKDLDNSVINKLYSDLVLQYSFITFFNASLPIVGFIALIHNLIKVQHDAYRFLKFYRRPTIEQVPDIEGWNQVLKAVTVFGCISNTFVVAFRTNFIQRVLYRNQHNGSLAGFINSTLSKFDVNDFQDADSLIDHKDAKYCYYEGFRHPPEHEKKYQPTEEYWHHVAIRTIYFIILEKFTFLLAMVLSYLIPEIPRKVKVKIENDEKLLRIAREERMELEKSLV